MWEMQAMSSNSQTSTNSNMIENITDNENGSIITENDSTIIATAVAPLPTDCSAGGGGGGGGLLCSGNNILNTDNLQLIHHRSSYDNNNTSATQIHLQQLANSGHTVLQCSAANRNNGGGLTTTSTTKTNENEQCDVSSALFIDGMMHPALRGIKAVNIGIVEIIFRFSVTFKFKCLYCLQAVPELVVI